MATALDGDHTVMTWILVFWLATPENHTIYTEFASERECRITQREWQQRLDRVASKLVAECRQREAPRASP